MSTDPNVPDAQAVHSGVKYPDTPRGHVSAFLDVFEADSVNDLTFSGVVAANLTPGDPVLMVEHLRGLMAENVQLERKLSWPDGQPQDTAAPYRPIPYEDEFISIIQSGSFYAEVTAFRRLAATIGVEQTYRKWTKLQRRARAETAQPQDDGDVRAVAALLRTWATEGVGAGRYDPLTSVAEHLESRFADRIAALEARDAADGGAE